MPGALRGLRSSLTYLVVFVAAFAAVSTSWYLVAFQHRAPSNPTSYASAKAEFDRTTKTLTLPAGTTWPAKLRYPHTPGATYVFSPGFGKQQAQFYWYCAWSRDWLSRYADGTGTYSLNEMKKVTTMDLFERDFDLTTQQYTERELTDAQAGDPKALRTDVDLNCPPPVTK